MDSFLKLKAETDRENISTQFLASEFVRLKLLEEEYKILKQIISYAVEHDVKDQGVIIKISKSNMMRNTSWRDILNEAMKTASQEV